MLLTHAYVHWAANVLLAVFAPAFPFVAIVTGNPPADRPSP